MARTRYCGRRRERDQNGVAGAVGAGGVGGGGGVGADAGPARRTGGVGAGDVGAAGIGPVRRAGGGCAGPRAPVPVLAPPFLAQPAAPPLADGGVPLVDSGSGGAVRPVPTPAAGHCRAELWLSAVGMPDSPSEEVARTPLSAEPLAVPSDAPPTPSAARRAQRDARDMLAAAPGTTVPAAVADTRRKPKADSRQETSARSLAPSMP
jgi:hypothetical protein